MNRGPRRGTAPRGFTLVELVVVVALIGLTLGVATPAFVEVLDRPDAASVVARRLRDARAMAVREARAVDLVIDPANARAWLSTTIEGTKVDSSFVLPVDAAALRYAVPRLRFHFRPDGSGWGDSLVVEERGRATAIRLESPGGTVSVGAPSTPRAPR